ncbi:MAG: bifunctional 5,10-methylenetetrahydrofolate dehydrogenase/5,10-methenyltetrahydrofolate cyclohydrolase [Panacagrimonas sp.]
MDEQKRIDGKAHAAAVTEEVRQATAALLASCGIKPGLAVILVGADPASQVYVRNKSKAAQACGFHSVQHTLPADATLDTVLAEIDALNRDDSIHGILVQLPLPAQLDETQITQAVAPAKDVDGFHFQNIGRLHAGQLDQALLPCTPAGCMRLIRRRLGEDLSGLSAVVLGRSNIVGKPMAALLLQANATVTIAHSRTRALQDVVGAADIVVAAVGRAQMVRGDWVKPGAVVIDVGINRVENPPGSEKPSRLVGDVDYDTAVARAAAITPVPGGVGPMTIAMLMANTLQAAQRSVRQR